MEHHAGDIAGEADRSLGIVVLFCFGTKVIAARRCSIQITTASIEVPSVGGIALEGYHLHVSSGIRRGTFDGDARGTAVVAFLVGAHGHLVGIVQEDDLITGGKVVDVSYQYIGVQATHIPNSQGVTGCCRLIVGGTFHRCRDGRSAYASGKGHCARARVNSGHRGVAAAVGHRTITVVAQCRSCERIAESQGHRIGGPSKSRGRTGIDDTDSCGCRSCRMAIGLGDVCS